MSLYIWSVDMRHLITSRNSSLLVIITSMQRTISLKNNIHIYIDATSMGNF